jgi:hypothetical protein
LTPSIFKIDYFYPPFPPRTGALTPPELLVGAGELEDPPPELLVGVVVEPPPPDDLVGDVVVPPPPELLVGVVVVPPPPELLVGDVVDPPLFPELLVGDVVEPPLLLPLPVEDGSVLVGVVVVPLSLDPDDQVMNGFFFLGVSGSTGGPSTGLLVVVVEVGFVVPVPGSLTGSVVEPAEVEVVPGFFPGALITGSFSGLVPPVVEPSPLGTPPFPLLISTGTSF